MAVRNLWQRVASMEQSDRGWEGDDSHHEVNHGSQALIDRSSKWKSTWRTVAVG